MRTTVMARACLHDLISVMSMSRWVSSLHRNDEPRGAYNSCGSDSGNLPWSMLHRTFALAKPVTHLRQFFSVARIVDPSVGVQSEYAEVAALQHKFREIVARDRKVVEAVS